MIRAIFRNWSIEPNRARLSPAALRQAESYVFDNVYSRVIGSLSEDGVVPLIPIN